MTGASAYIQRHRTVFAMNESGGPVQIAIDDDAPQEVGPQTKLSLAEGKHHVKVTGSLNDEFDIEMATGFFERLTRRPVWVINADGAAALNCETVHYAANPRPCEPRLLVGERFFYLPHVDYAFEAPPQQLQVESRSSEVTKICLSRINEPAIDVFPYVLDACDIDAALRFCEGRLRGNREDSALLNGYLRETEKSGQNERARQFLKTGLEHQPVAVTWHRAYQDLCKLKQENAALTTQYDAFLKKSPDNGRLLYLRGRLETDHEKANDYFHRACKAEAALGWPWMALAYSAASSGDWEQSRTLADKAFELKLDDMNLREIRHEARLATKDTAVMEAEYRECLRSGSAAENMAAVGNLCDVLALDKRIADGRRVVDEWENGLPPEVRSSDGLFTWRQLVLYRLGDLDAVRRAMQESAGRISPEVRLHVLATTGHPQEVLGDPAYAESLEEPWNALTLSLALSLADKKSEAATWREKACDGLEQRDPDSCQAAALLRNPKATDEEVRNVMLPTGFKALLLVVMADCYPERKAYLFALARRLNVGGMPPRLLVEKALAGSQ